jgi:hypothetical protein
MISRPATLSTNVLGPRMVVKMRNKVRFTPTLSHFKILTGIVAHKPMDCIHRDASPLA